MALKRPALAAGHLVPLLQTAAGVLVGQGGLQRARDSSKEGYSSSATWPTCNLTRTSSRACGAWLSTTSQRPSTMSAPASRAGRRGHAARAERRRGRLARRRRGRRATAAAATAAALRQGRPPPTRRAALRRVTPRLAGERAHVSAYAYAVAAAAERVRAEPRVPNCRDQRGPALRRRRRGLQSS